MTVEAHGESRAIYLLDWACISLPECYTSTTTVTDKFTGKVVGEPYRKNPTSGSTRGPKEPCCTWASSQMLNGHWIARLLANSPDGLRARGLYSTALL